MDGELELEVQVEKALVGWFSAEGALFFLAHEWTLKTHKDQRCSRESPKLPLPQTGSLVVA